MRAVPVLFLALVLGCGHSDQQPNIVDDWIATGAYASEEIVVSFKAGGDVTISSKSSKPVTMRYRIEPIETWHKRRASQIPEAQGETAIVFPGITHVVTAYRPDFPDEFNPSHNYFYDPTADTLSVSFVAELRRKP